MAPPLSSWLSPDLIRGSVPGHPDQEKRGASRNEITGTGPVMTWRGYRGSEPPLLSRLTARAEGRVELAGGVALGHLGRREHALDLGGLAGGVEFLQALLAELGHRLHGGLQILARVELARVLGQHLADLAGHRHAVVGVDVDLAHAVLDAALDL